jgi:hypothetical protein
MRHFLAILMLVFTAWAILPSAAQAHGTPHEMPVLGACPDCTEMADAQAAEQSKGHRCHHGAGCAVHGLLAITPTVAPAPGLTGGPRPAAHAAPRSAMVARDLPPPRS